MVTAVLVALSVAVVFNVVMVTAVLISFSAKAGLVMLIVVGATVSENSREIDLFNFAKCKPFFYQ